MPPHAPKDRWDVVYARSFKNQPEGHALYQDLTARELRPGSCGYFDHNGNWQLVANLTNRELGVFDKVPNLQVRTKNGAQWPLRTSQGVSGNKLGASAGLSVSPLPAGGRVTTSYQASTGEGAILVTDGPVTEAQALPISAMCKWLNDNAQRIVAARPDANGHDLWLVTKTYSAEKRALAILRTRDDSVQLMVDADGAGVGKAGATAEWWRGSKDNAWNVFEDSHGAVLAFDGICYHRRWYQINPRADAQHQPKFLSGSNGDMKLRPVLAEREDSGVVYWEPELLPANLDGVVVADGDSSSSEEDGDE